MPKQFASLTEFAEYLLALKEIDQEKKQTALEEIGEYVKAKARSKFGTYQDASGEFPAWSSLTNATQQDRVRQGYEADNPLYRSGDLAFSVDDVIEPDRLVVGSADPVMLYQELGTVHISPRPVLGPAMLESLPQIKIILGKMTLNWLTGK